MDLVEIYLRAIAAQLPKAEREDIVAELREMIIERIAAREAELGRPLSAQETEAVLHRIGHPLEVAANYGGGPRQIIGPRLYPYYIFALKGLLVVLGVVCALTFVSTLAVSAGDLGRALAATISAAVSGAVTMVGVLTIIAAAIEHFQVQLGFLERWRIKDLKVLEVAALDPLTFGRDLADRIRRATPRDPGPRRRTRHDHPVLWIVGGALLALWWIGAIHVFAAAPPPRGEHDPLVEQVLRIDWRGVKAALYTPVLTFALALIGLGGALLLGPPSFVRYAGARVLLSIFALWALGVAWFASPLTGLIDIASADDLIRHIRTFWSDDGRRIPETIAALIIPSAFVGEGLTGLWWLGQLTRSAPLEHRLA